MHEPERVATGPDAAGKFTVTVTLRTWTEAIPQIVALTSDQYKAYLCWLDVITLNTPNHPDLFALEASGVSVDDVWRLMTGEPYLTPRPAGSRAS
jgi:hypothetical protein